MQVLVDIERNEVHSPVSQSIIFTLVLAVLVKFCLIDAERQMYSYYDVPFDRLAGHIFSLSHTS